MHRRKFGEKNKADESERLSESVRERARKSKVSNFDDELKLSV